MPHTFCAQLSCTLLRTEKKSMGYYHHIDVPPARAQCEVEHWRNLPTTILRPTNAAY
ncbi:hypothetical protein EI94DRAFT_1666748 [Lactarius quietus]|nr:hypothetical protein EI94DRAFT_1666748 [Lactarius quietus]